MECVGYASLNADRDEHSHPLNAASRDEQIPNCQSESAGNNLPVCQSPPFLS
jgi:hypothetical protein